ncbi:metallophosphoesterase family protein [Leptospira bandrabouensis]|uniref:metallophosphoesterase family protein n=1 Tax=Leptospira bandrabouensis TaxID=2484903 RepID=UPI0010915ACB|nr:metallophosphoesterase [Leptospira bandrabouensis]TGN08594.1 calcineurin [Leptospira bandrabouensis]
MIKIGNIADIHLQGGFESKEAIALLKAGEIFRERNVDLVCVGGDIFEDVSTEEQRLVFKQFIDGFAANTPILVIRGNHDKPKELLCYQSRVFGNVYVSETPEIFDFYLGQEKERIQFLTIPHFSAGALALQSKSVEQLAEKGTNAFMDLLDSYYQKIQNADFPSFVPFHGTISDAKLDNDRIPRMNGIHLPLGLLESFGCPVVGGHYHKVQNVGGKVWYPGSITRQTWGEAKDDKGILIWTWNGGLWDEMPEFISLNPEPMISISAKWNGTEFIGESGETIDLTKISESNAKLRFRYTVDKELTHTIPTNLKEILSAVDPTVKIEKTTVTKIAVRNEEIAKTNDIEESLRIYFKSKGMEDFDIEIHLAERRAIIQAQEVKEEVAA